MKVRNKLFAVVISVLLVLGALAGCQNAPADVKEPVTLKNISVKSDTLKTDYKLNEKLNVDGGALVVDYSNGGQEIIGISVEMLSGFDSSKAGEKVMYLKYKDRKLVIYYTVAPLTYTADEYFVTEKNEDGTLTLTGLTGDYPRVIDVPMQIGKRTITTVGEGAFKKADIDKIIFNGNITKISTYAFYGNKNIDEVVLCDSIKTLGDYAFCYASSLESIRFGNGLKSINFAVMYGCKSLVRVVMPNALESIGVMAFYGCAALDEIELPKTVTEVKRQAFMGCSLLKSISIPSVKDIDQEAFYECFNLESVDITGANTIGANAFDYCGFTELILPEGLINIGEYAFAHCLDLTSVTLPSSISSANMGLCCFSGCENLATITLAEDMPNFTKIPLGTFQQCDKLTGFVVSKYIVSIDEGAFSYGTTKDKPIFDIDFTNATALQTIGDSAFQGRLLKTAITLPDSVKTIGDCFNSVSGLEELIFTDNSSVNAIARFFMGGCKSIKKIVLPKGLTMFDEDWFGWKSNIQEISLARTKITTITEDCFDNDDFPELKTLIFPSTITKIERFAFSCKKLENLEFASLDNLSTIFPQDMGLGSCALKNIYVPASKVEEYKALECFKKHRNLIKAAPVAV